MGKYYKTAKPTFVDDAMYKAPYELMAKALAAKDADFKENEEALAELGDVGDLLKYMNADEAKRNEIIKTFGDTSTSLSEAINNSPALADAYGADIRKAQRAWKDEITSGTLRKIHRNEEQKTKLFADIDKRQGVSEESKRLAQAVAMDRYEKQGGVEGGNFTEDMNLYEEIDENKYVEHLKKVVNEDGSNWSQDLKGEDGYIDTSAGSTRYIKKERLNEIVDSDPKTLDWKKEKRQQLELKAELGEINEEDIEAIFNEDYKDFKENVAKKLAFKISGSKSSTRADSGYNSSGRNPSNWVGASGKLDTPVESVDAKTLQANAGLKKTKNGNWKNSSSIGLFKDKSGNTPGTTDSNGNIIYNEEEGRQNFLREDADFKKAVAGVPDFSYEDIVSTFRSAADEAYEQKDKTKLSNEWAKKLKGMSAKLGGGYGVSKIAALINAGQSYNYILDPLINIDDTDTPFVQQQAAAKVIVSSLRQAPVTTPITWTVVGDGNKLTETGEGSINDLVSKNYVSSPQTTANKPTPYFDTLQRLTDAEGAPLSDKVNGEDKYFYSEKEYKNYMATKLGKTPNQISVPSKMTKVSVEDTKTKLFDYIIDPKGANVHKGHKYDFGNGFTRPKKIHFYYITKEIGQGANRKTIRIEIPEKSLTSSFGSVDKGRIAN